MFKADFSKNKRLARYIEKDQALTSGRPAVVAFMKKDPKEKLSVNSLSIETERQIAAAYSAQWHLERPVAVAICPVQNYVDQASKVGVKLSAIEEQKNWAFDKEGQATEGFTHKSTKISKSHCLCNFTEIFDTGQELSFATYMMQSVRWKPF